MIYDTLPWYGSLGPNPGLKGTKYNTLNHNLVHLPPISLLQREKKNIESSLQESDHTLPCPTLWFFKWKGSDDHVWKKEGLLAAND